MTYLIGAASWLSHQDGDALEWPINDFHQRVFSAVECEQALLFRDGDMPVGFVTWAWLKEDQDRRYRIRPFSLSAEERQGGGFLWLIDALVLQPYSRSIASQVLNDMFETGTPIRWLSRGNAGRVNRVVAGMGDEKKIWKNWP